MAALALLILVRDSRIPLIYNLALLFYHANLSLNKTWVTLCISSQTQGSQLTGRFTWKLYEKLYFYAPFGLYLCEA
jgi:hypothetical protein